MKLTSARTALLTLAIATAAHSAAAAPYQSADPKSTGPQLGAGQQGATGQQPAPAQPQAGNGSQQHGKEQLGPVAESIRPYRSAGRDPFRKTIIKPAGKVKPPKAVGFPSLEARRALFQQKVAETRRKDEPEPSPLTQYLVTELDVIGIFKDDKGPGAFVRARPTGTTFFVRRGSRCYNGEILRIEGESADLSGSRVVFREEVHTDVDGKTTTQDHVVAKTAAPASRS
jgi:hypothetical protein